MTEAPPTDPNRVTRRTRLTALIVATAMFMQNLDSTMIATALPTMAESFGYDPVRMNVALTSYLLSLAVCIPAIFLVKPPTIGWRNILLIGSFLSLGQFALLYLALSLGMPPGLASLLLQTQVIFSLVISALFLRERPSRRQLIGTIIGMLGLCIVIVGRSGAVPHDDDAEAEHPDNGAD